MIEKFNKTPNSVWYTLLQSLIAFLLSFCLYLFINNLFESSPVNTGGYVTNTQLFLAFIYQLPLQNMALLLLILSFPLTFIILRKKVK